MIHLLPGTEQPDAATERWLPPGWPLLAFTTTLYAGLAVWITWPLTAQINRRVAGDLGDPLMATWAMSWVMTHLTRALTGDVAALQQLWDANIFYPESNTLALSEHFVGQSVQMLPLWWITGNPILAYNVSVLLTFIVTAVAVMMLTRAFTGGVVAPLFAGVLASFNTYRFGPELTHLHVLSIQWLPLAMLAIHRFIAAGTQGWLVATGLFVIALNLSSGALMVFGVPFLVLFALVDLAIQRRLGDLSRWAGLIVAGICAALVTTPFVTPYLEMQKRLAAAGPLGEASAAAGSAAYATDVLPWAGVPLVLAGLALLGLAFEKPVARRAYTVTMAVFGALAVWLSLGPAVLPDGLIAFARQFYSSVPGFDGLDVMHRYTAVALVFLAVLSGIGAATVRRRVRLGSWVVLALTLGFLGQIWPAFPMQVALPSPGLQPPPAYLGPTASLPPLYQTVAGLDPQTVLVELPFPDRGYNLRYQYFAGLHRRRLMNGDSTILPPDFRARSRALASPLETPVRTIDTLRLATHVIVHEGAWADDTGARLVALLEEAGATPVATVDGAHLLALRDLARHARR